LTGFTSQPLVPPGVAPVPRRSMTDTTTTADANVTDQAIGSVALVIWATHPLTLLLAYAGIEGAIRLCAAAFSDNILGIFPLFLLD